MIGTSRTRLVQLGALTALVATGLAGCFPSSSSQTIPPATATPGPSGQYFVAERGLNQVVEVTAAGATVATIKSGNAPTAFAYTASTSPQDLWVLNAGSNTVGLIDEQTATLLKTVTVGEDPEYAASDDKATLYVANVQSHSISVIDATSATVIHTISLPDAPVSVSVAPGAHTLFVGLHSNVVDLVDTASYTITGQLTVSGTLVGAMGSDSPLSAAGTAQVMIVTSDGKIEELLGSGTTYAPAAAYSIPGGTLALSQHSGFIVLNQTASTATGLAIQANAPLYTTPTGSRPRGVADDTHNQWNAVANSGDDTIGFYNPSNGAAIALSIKLAAGAQPYDVWTSYFKPSPSPSPSSAPTSTPTTAPTVAPTATPTATPVPNVSDNVYVADYTGGGLDEFDAPLTMNMTPTRVLAQNAPYGVAVHGSTLAVTLVSGVIETYTLSSSSSPTITTGSNYIAGDAFDPSGNLWVASDGNNVYEFTPPFTSGMTPAKTVGGFGSSNFLAFDNSGTMYVTVGGGYSAIMTSSAPSYGSIGTMLMAPSGSAFEGVSVYNGKLAVADAGTSRVLVYSLPLTSSSTPDFAVPTGSNPVGVAYDSAGNLFVATAGDGSVTEFAAPLATTSQKIAVLKPQSMSLASSGPAGVAVSP